MSQLYARVFTQILDSSIAEDFTVRHVFEDLFKLCSKEGILDMTRQAIARRLNVPMDILNDAIEKLESEDPNSRDKDFGGRRIERLDEHRDWGWRILNWPKYDALRSRADVAIRVARHRISEPTGAFKKPTVEEMKEHAIKIGLPEAEAIKCFHYYESNGWKVGRNPMRSWTSAMVNWKTNFLKGNNGTHQQNHRNGTRPATGAEQRTLGIPEQSGPSLGELLRRKRQSRDALAAPPNRPGSDNAGRPGDGDGGGALVQPGAA